MNKKKKSFKKYYKNSKKRPYDLTKKKNNNSVIVMPLRRKRNKYSNLELEYGIARKSVTSSGNGGKGGELNLSKDLFYHIDGRPLNDKEWFNMMLIRNQDRNEDWEKRFEDRRFKRFILNHEHAMEKRREDRIDIHNDRLYDLVRKGIIYYKNGTYFTNDERIFDFLCEENKKRKKELRDKKIADETDRIYKDKISKLCIQDNPLLRKIIKRKVSKEYDRNELKLIKKEYKSNKKVSRWERKYGKLTKKIF